MKKFKRSIFLFLTFLWSTTSLFSQVNKVVYDHFTPFVKQSSNYLMPGEELEINAGVGAYSSAAKPQININGQSIAIGQDGSATLKFNVSGPGARAVPVKVSYTKPDGTKETKTFDVRYTVGTPGGAAVMPDKMNVFYIGVDNPITIGSPTGWDKTQVSITGGTIIGSGSNRIVRVSALGKAAITVNADNKPTTFEFRCKKIPDPVFKVASGTVRMTATEFKSQSFCRADLENFDFDLKFIVVSATVHFAGTNFPNSAIAQLTGNNLSSLNTYIQRCGPGSSITFDNIKVEGPDGIRSIEAKSIVLY